MEVAPDPHQVLGVLRVEGYAGADAGVAEEEIAETRREFQPVQEIPVGRRHGGGQRAAAFSETIHAVEVELDAVGLRRLDAAIAGEDALRVRLGEEIEEADVVVAGEREDAPVRRGLADQELDDAFRLRPAVDIVAKMD